MPYIDMIGKVLGTLAIPTTHYLSDRTFVYKHHVDL